MRFVKFWKRVINLQPIICDFVVVVKRFTQLKKIILSQDLALKNRC